HRRESPQWFPPAAMPARTAGHRTPDMIEHMFYGGGMRWNALSLDGQEPGLFGRPVTVDTPEFRGITFHEIRAKSIINRVPDAARVPFRWTITPYRGCSHPCVYCYARASHRYLDLAPGHDFDSQIVVKVNAPELVRRELAAPRWKGEPIAMGTNVDCYQ